MERMGREEKGRGDKREEKRREGKGRSINEINYITNFKKKIQEKTMILKKTNAINNMIPDRH